MVLVSAFIREIYGGSDTLRQCKMILSANKSLNICTIEKNPKNSDLIYLCLTLTCGIILHEYWCS